MHKPIWEEMSSACEELHQQLTNLCSSLLKDTARHEKLHKLEESTDVWSLTILEPKDSKLHEEKEYSSLMAQLKDAEWYIPLTINNLIPDAPTTRYSFMKKLRQKGLYLREDSLAVLYTRSFGNNIENLYYVWTIPIDNVDDGKHRDAQRKCEREAPSYHSRFMKRRFMDTAESLQVASSKAKLRRLYVIATSDASSGRSAAENEIDQRVMSFVELEDESILCDLRKLNHRPSHYDQFFEAAAKYINQEVETSVDDRRHDQVVHLAKAISAQDLYK